MERDDVLTVYDSMATICGDERQGPGIATRLRARIAITSMYAAADKLLREIDAMVADREGDNPLTDPGCPVCTLGTVPNRLNTGLCGYHALQAALASQDAGGVEG